MPDSPLDYDENKKRRKKERVMDMVFSMPIFTAEDNHITATFHTQGGDIHLRFYTPDQLFAFMCALMDKAALVWPKNNVVKKWTEQK